MRRYLWALTAAIAIALGYDAYAQTSVFGQYAQPHTWGSTQTFNNIVVNGTCTGCGSATPGGSSGNLQTNNGAGGFGAFAGTTCTNQAATALNASGTATCTTLTSAYVDSTIVTSLLPLHLTDANTVDQYNSTTAQVFSIFNTRTDASNYEKLQFGTPVSANVFGIRPVSLGTGTARQFNIYQADTSVAFVAFTTAASNPAIDIGNNSSPAGTAQTNGHIRVGTGSNNHTATSGTSIGVLMGENGAPTSTSTMVFVPLRIGPTINYSNGTPGAGSYEALKIAVTETALPTGTNYLLRASAGAAGTTDKFTVTNGGITSAIEYLTGGTQAVAVANVGANSCGSTAATIAGNDNAGEIVVGATSGTQCRIAFVTAAPTRRHCTANDSTTTIAVRTTYVDTTHSDLLGAFVAGDSVTYHCFAR